VGKQKKQCKNSEDIWHNFHYFSNEINSMIKKEKSLTDDLVIRGSF